MVTIGFLSLIDKKRKKKVLIPSPSQFSTQWANPTHPRCLVILFLSKIIHVSKPPTGFRCLVNLRSLLRLLRPPRLVDLIENLKRPGKVRCWPWHACRRVRDESCIHEAHVCAMTRTAADLNLRAWMLSECPEGR